MGFGGYSFLICFFILLVSPVLALLHHLDGIAAARGWPVTRWITQDNNYRARGLYDSLSTRTGWITYEMTAATTGRQS